jgi:predicted dehydrogenase
MSEIPVGILGVTEGNGHPFSFAAIINGYHAEGLAASGWAGIHDYVRRRDPSDFGAGELRVTHAWTQDPETTGRLCAAGGIPHRVASPAEMIGQVAAVILARDDHENHAAVALPFLEAGLPVFVDKPLSLAPEELRRFRPHLEQGRLMSASGLRYARELDEPRANLAAWGALRLVHGTVLFDWERYGVHIVEAILGLLPGRPVAVTPHPAAHASLALEMDDGTPVLLDALGEVPKVFRVDLFGAARISSHEVEDNFSMFRRMLCRFAEMVRTGEPPIAPERTLDVMRVLIAGQRARREQRRIVIDELGV